MPGSKASLLPPSLPKEQLIKVLAVTLLSKRTSKN